MTTTALDPAAAVTEAGGRDRRWLILAVIGIAQLMIVLDASIVNIALPTPRPPCTSATPSGSGPSRRTR